MPSSSAALNCRAWIRTWLYYAVPFWLGCQIYIETAKYFYSKFWAYGILLTLIKSSISSLENRSLVLKVDHMLTTSLVSIFRIRLLSVNQGSACKIFSISKILHLAQNVRKNLTSYRSYGDVKFFNLTILQSYAFVRKSILQFYNLTRFSQIQSYNYV